jgi:hypothetical protein
MKRTTLTNLAIGDPKRGVVFEITPESVVVREPADGLCSCTNHFCTDQLRPEVQPDIFWTHERFDELEQTRKLSKVGIEDIHKSLHAVSVQNHTLQTMVFEPARLRMHLAIGACPSSAKELTTLDLAPLFKLNHEDLPDSKIGLSDGARVPKSEATKCKKGSPPSRFEP